MSFSEFVAADVSAPGLQARTERGPVWDAGDSAARQSISLPGRGVEVRHAEAAVADNLELQAEDDVIDGIDFHGPFQHVAGGIHNETQVEVVIPARQLLLGADGDGVRPKSRFRPDSGRLELRADNALSEYWTRSSRRSGSRMLAE